MIVVVIGSITDYSIRIVNAVQFIKNSAFVARQQLLPREDILPGFKATAGLCGSGRQGANEVSGASEERASTGGEAVPR
ncbi:MAG: hypothetical protein U0T73_08505 [Chitinophagales bacterium]